MTEPAQAFMYSFPRIPAPEVAQVENLLWQLQQYEHLTSAQQSQIQQTSLRTLLIHAYTHTPFWRQRLEQISWSPDTSKNHNPLEVLASLPPLTRKDLQEHKHSLDCREVMGKEACTSAQTSGSTGNPVEVYKHLPSYTPNYKAHTMRLMQWLSLDYSRAMVRYSVKTEDGVQSHWGAPASWYHNTGPLVLVRSLKRDISDMYPPLHRHKPAYMASNASVAHALALHALEHETSARRPRLKHILATAEKITPQIRQDCRSAFGAEISNRYSCEELGWIAAQCPKHEHLHQLGANVIVEIVDTEGKPCPVGKAGKVLVTALHSYAMPLIRYDIGDVAEWGEPCDCGINLPVIKKVWGRDRDFVRLPSGERRFVIVISRNYTEHAPITDMRFRYYTNAVLSIEMVCETPLTDKQRTAIIHEAQEMVGHECRVVLTQKESIDWGETDKRDAFASVDEEWKRTC